MIYLIDLTFTQLCEVFIRQLRHFWSNSVLCSSVQLELLPLR